MHTSIAFHAPRRAHGTSPRAASYSFRPTHEGGTRNRPSCSILTHFTLRTERSARNCLLCNTLHFITERDISNGARTTGTVHNINFHAWDGIAWGISDTQLVFVWFCFCITEPRATSKDASHDPQGFHTNCRSISPDGYTSVTVLCSRGV